MNKNISSTLFVLALGRFISGQAQAATATATLEVSATVGVACSVSTVPVNFGNYNGNVIYASGSITVTCPPGAPYNIALDAGLFFNGEYRMIANGGESILGSIDYVIWHPMGGQWGDSDFDSTYQYGASVSGTGDGSDQHYPVSAGLFPGYYYGIFDGIYMDVVSVTVHY
jgi:spore coat protein U-like protein